MRLALAVAVPLLMASPALASSEQDSVPPRCKQHHHPATEQRQLAQRVFKMRQWRRPAPGHGAKRTMRRLRSCAAPRVRDDMRRTWQKEKRQLYRHAAFRQIAPYSGGGTYWAIPWPIVECESGGLWSAYNSSGAAGPYQIMGEWGRPWPVTSWHDKMAHHHIASDLYAGGSGASNWVCA
jgi:hypothetical protein